MHLPRAHNHVHLADLISCQNIHTSLLTKIRTLDGLLNEWGIEIADIARHFQMAWGLEVIFSDCLHAVGEKSKWQQWLIWVCPELSKLFHQRKRGVYLSRKEKGVGANTGATARKGAFEG